MPVEVIIRLFAYLDINGKMKDEDFSRLEEIEMTNAQAWDYAIGMIKVDGLEPTEDFKEYIEKEKRGEVTMEDAKKYLDKKYKMKETTDA